MYRAHSLRARLRPSAPALGVAVLLAAALTACGGGATPTASPSPVSTAVPTPIRPSLASPVPSPSPGTGLLGTTDTYTVKPGDTLGTIAQRVYGDATKWRVIYDANRDTIGDNPDSVKVDMRLKIPKAP